MRLNAEKISKRVMAALLVVATIFTFAGCSSAGKNDDLATTDTYKEVSFGDASGNFGGGMTTLNPADSWNGWYLSFYGTGETLYKLDEGYNPTPCLAESATMVDDYTWEFQIRDDVTFHNGEKLTAERVKASLEYMLGLTARATETYHFESITADGQKLTIKTTEPNPALLNDLCDPLSVIQYIGDDVDYDNAPIMTGPFIITSYVSGEKTVLESYDNYWGGKAKLDKVNLITLTDKDALALALQSGEISLAIELDPSSVPLFSDTNKYEMHSAVSTSTLYYVFNNTGRYGTDDVIRKAVSMCIDRESVENLSNGVRLATYGLFPDTMNFGGTEGLNLSVSKLDLDGAKKLLNDAGYKDTDGDGILDKDGEKLSLILVSSTDSETLNNSQALQSNLKTIGVELKIEEYKSASDGTAEGKEWDLVTGGKILAPTGNIQYFANTMLVTGSSTNVGNYSNSQIDALAKQLETTFDSAERDKIAKQIEQLVLDDGYIAPIVFRKFFAISTVNIKDFNINPTKYYFLDNKIDVEL